MGQVSRGEQPAEDNDPMVKGHIEREPQFRLAWEEHLGQEERAEVRAAVRQGRVVSERGLAIFAVGLAAKTLRRMWMGWVAVLCTVTVASLWIIVHCVIGAAAASTQWCAFWLLLGIAGVVIAPLQVTRTKRNIERARDLNRDLISRAGSSSET